MSVDISSWYIIYKIPQIIDKNHFHIKFFTSVKFDINKFYNVFQSESRPPEALERRLFFSLEAVGRRSGASSYEVLGRPADRRTLQLGVSEGSEAAF